MALTVNMRKYSERSFVVYGPDTEEIKIKLGELKGAFNPNLKNPLNGERLKGWIFSKSRKGSVIDYFIMNDVDYNEVGQWW